ncbi:MAG TPA: helix-turn-helix domain-containing protein [Herpetosiphonaceae bacterium]|nr:helix-turn-helix domain-containing protein [Herpetosiphonaceae bacterium]
MTNGRPLLIDEAIDALGVSDKTVRRMLKSGLLVEYGRDDRGRVLITPSSIEAARQQLTERRAEQDEVRELLPALTTQAELLGRQLDRFTEMIDERDAVIRSLTEELTTLRVERKYLPGPGRVQELEQRIAELESQLAAVNSGNSRPMTDQAENTTGKGWLRRLLGL